jgi:hypothetical protein
LLCEVAPLLRGRIRNLSQQDVGDLLFSLSREYARLYTECLYDTEYLAAYTLRLE